MAFGRKKPAAAPASVVQAPAEPVVLSPAEQVVGLEARLGDARADLEAARATLSAAQAAYGCAADDADLDAAVAARADITDAEVAADVAGRAVERLQTELATLREGIAAAAELAEREGLRTAAEAAAAAYRAAFEEQMPVITARLHELIRLEAEAELAREDAAARGIDLPRANAFRDDLGAPRVDVGRRDLDLWVNPHCGKPYPDDHQTRIKARSDGCGTITHNSGHVTVIEGKQRFVETTFHPTVPVRPAKSLAESLSIPPMMVGDRPGWERPNGKYAVSARDALQKLAELQGPRPAPAEPKLSTERKPTEPVRLVAAQRDVPRTALRRDIG